MKAIWAVRLLAFAGVLALVVTTATADEGATSFTTSMSGFNETPAILTDGTGSFTATVHGNTISYSETFGGLTSNATVSHLHFGARGVTGAPFVFLCGGAGTPACPAAGGTVNGTITAANVLGVANQNITAGDFAGLLRILRSGDAYVNVHTTKFPAGEIRGQVSAAED